MHGAEGAERYPLPPRSSILLLDESAPVVWLKITDDAGYATLSPYDIVPHEEKVVDTKSLEDRIARLEEIINEQSNVESSQPIKRVLKESKSN